MNSQEKHLSTISVAQKPKKDSKKDLKHSKFNDTRAHLEVDLRVWLTQKANRSTKHIRTIRGSNFYFYFRLERQCSE